MVTETTLEVYEELTPQFVALLTETQKKTGLTDAQKTDQILLDTIGYIKSCTNEIILEVLGKVLNLEEGHAHCRCHDHE